MNNGENTKKRITLKDIAKVVGITPAAVGRALNDSPDISAQTKIRVKKVADEMGYTTNYLASALRTNRTYTLCILVPDIANPYNARLVKGIEDTARQNNFMVFMINTEESAEKERAAIQTAQSLQVEGILAIPVNLDNYENLRIPFVLMARYFTDPDFKRYNYVVNDDNIVMNLAISHLLENFDRDIYLINGPRSFVTAQNRMTAFKDKVQASGRSFSDRQIVFEENSSEGGYRGFTSIFSDLSLPVSVVCCTDYIAIGVIKAVLDKGLRIPEDISIVGIDDIEILSYLPAPLSSVHLPRYVLGVHATRHFFKMINAGRQPIAPLNMVVEPELMIRASSTPTGKDR